VKADRKRHSLALHTLRTRPAYDIELEWIFNRAEAAMGLRSTFVGMLGARFPAPPEPSPEDNVGAAHAYRTIRGWLLAIDDRDAGVLQAAYEARPWPSELYDDLGRLTGVVVRLACDPVSWPAARKAQQAVEMARAEALAKDSVEWRGSSSSPLAALRRQAEERFARAHRAYARVRGDGPCAVRAS
jgi:hypothetical protein